MPKKRGNEITMAICRKRLYGRLSDARVGARRTGGGVEPYRCPECRKYHIGHPLGYGAVRREKEKIVG